MGRHLLAARPVPKNQPGASHHGGATARGFLGGVE
jgi:hypothetical protein